MDTSHRVLRERPPKSKKKRRKDSNPDPFTTQNNAAADVIHLRIPEPPKSPTPTTRTSRKINSVDVPLPSQGSGSILGSATRDDYLLAIEDAIDSLILAFKIHSTQHPEPTKEQLHQQKLMDTACISLQKITKNLVGEDLEESVRKSDERYRKARHYTDTSTATTQETVSLTDRIRVIEHKLDHLLQKPSYASVIQQHVPPIPSQLVVQSPPTPVEDTRFIVEVENPVPKDFNPLTLREKLNNLLPPHASRFTAIRRSYQGNLICYTLGKPTSTIESFEEWSAAIEYKAIRINAEDKWTRRIFYMASPGTSATILEAELKEYNPGIPLAASPHLLSPTVALLLFPC